MTFRTRQISSVEIYPGRIDVAFVPSGTQGYADLVQSAVRFEVYGGFENRAFLTFLLL